LQRRAAAGISLRQCGQRVIGTGGGVPRGQVVGQTDRLGGDVRETPVSPKDILATTFHLLGIDPETQVRDAQGRPLPIAGDGKVRPELLA